MERLAPIAQPVTSGQEAQASTKRSPARYLWAKLIAIINEGAEIRKILDHIGVESSPPKINQARGPPLWDACDDAEPAQCFDDGADDDVDQSLSW